MKQPTGSRLLAGTRLKNIAQLSADVPPVRLVVSSAPHEEGVELRTPHSHKPLPPKLMPFSTSNTTDQCPPMPEHKRYQLSAFHPLLHAPPGTLIHCTALRRPKHIRSPPLLPPLHRRSALAIAASHCLRLQCLVPSARSLKGFAASGKIGLSSSACPTLASATTSAPAEASAATSRSHSSASVARTRWPRTAARGAAGRAAGRA